MILHIIPVRLFHFPGQCFATLLLHWQKPKTYQSTCVLWNPIFRLTLKFPFLTEPPRPWKRQTLGSFAQSSPRWCTSSASSSPPASTTAHPPGSSSWFRQECCHWKILSWGLCRRSAICWSTKLADTLIPPPSSQLRWKYCFPYFHEQVEEALDKIKNAQKTLKDFKSCFQVQKFVCLTALVKRLTRRSAHLTSKRTKRSKIGTSTKIWFSIDSTPSSNAWKLCSTAATQQTNFWCWKRFDIFPLKSNISENLCINEHRCIGTLVPGGF